MNTLKKVVIRTMWHGNPLSIWEELSIRSFLRFGYEVELYAYEDLAVTDGVSLRDAREVLPESMCFAYSSGLAAGSFAAFSNIFRFKLLYEKGGIWSDLDVLCLRPINCFPIDFAGYEFGLSVNQALLGFSPGHPVARSVYHDLERIGRSLFLGQASEVLSKNIEIHQGKCELLTSQAIYPIHWSSAWRLVDPDSCSLIEKKVADSFCLHWYNGVLNQGLGISKNALPPHGSYIHKKALEIFADDKFQIISEEEVRRLLSAYKDSDAFRQNSNMYKDHEISYQPMHDNSMPFLNI
jgi:hypothetical protein